MEKFDYFDYSSKEDVVINGVYMGYFIDSFSLCEDIDKKWDFLDEIYVISIEYRHDRRVSLLENFKKNGIQKVKFFIPVKMADISIEDRKKLNGVFYDNVTEIINYTVLGCYTSHLICHKNSYKRELNNHLIIEDDCVIKEISNQEYKDIENFVKNENFDALY